MFRQVSFQFLLLCLFFVHPPLLCDVACPLLCRFVSTTFFFSFPSCFRSTLAPSCFYYVGAVSFFRCSVSPLTVFLLIPDSVRAHGDSVRHRHGSGVPAELRGLVHFGRYHGETTRKVDRVRHGIPPGVSKVFAVPNMPGCPRYSQPRIQGIPGYLLGAFSETFSVHALHLFGKIDRLRKIDHSDGYDCEFR